MIAQQPMTVEQVQAGLAAAKAMGPREYLIARLASRYGLRASELAGIKVSDINFKDLTIRIVPGKGSIPTVECLTEDTVDAITQWLRVKPEGVFVFPGRENEAHLSRMAVYNIFKAIALRAGIPDTSRAPHAWRHSIGQKLADEGVAIQTIARVLRHRSIKSTQHYFKVSQRTADDAKAKHLGW